MGQAAKAGGKHVLWSKSDELAHKGAVLDIDTGVLRRDHVLVLRSPQVEITLGLGGTLMDFARKGETRGNSLLDTCYEADRAIARGDLDQRAQTRLALLDELEAARATGDTTKEREISGKLAAITKEIRAAAAEQRAMMVAAIERAKDAVDDDTRVARLVDAFATCALTQITAHHDLGDEETVDRAIEMKHTIVTALDAIAPGRRVALARLLTSPFAGVRASAGAHLLNANLLRERVVPLLQEIEKTAAGSAGWTAFWALSPNDHGAWLTGEERDS